jgi:hypothetical protein
LHFVSHFSSFLTQDAPHTLSLCPLHHQVNFQCEVPDDSADSTAEAVVKDWPFVSTDEARECGMDGGGGIKMW